MKQIKTDFSDIAVIGGGAAGLMAASFATGLGAKVTVFEKNSSKTRLSCDEYFDNSYLGKKLLITGKGRCNLTNNCNTEDFLKNVPENPKFLYSALRFFDTTETMNFFERNGCAVKTERGNRVFPASDKSRDVLDAMKSSINRDNCLFVNSEIKSVDFEDGFFVISDNRGRSYVFKRVIICTGGLSYPITGSTGDGYRFAEKFGHTIIPTQGSLVPIELSGDAHTDLQGLSLKNVVLSLFDKKGKKVFSEIGEMLFTHFGVSGPLVLSCSAHMRGEPSEYRLEIDMKPALDEPTLDARIVSDFNKYINRDLDNAMSDLLPSKLIVPFLGICGIPINTKPNSLKKEQRRIILSTFKHFPLSIKCLRPVDEAVITSGGICVKEISPSTMESKLVPGLYFAGEVIDVDAYTGGFNLQIAFSTGKLAGVSAANSIFD